MTTHDETPDELSDFSELLSEAPDASGRRLDVDPKARRRRRVRGWIIAATVILVLFGLPGTYAAWALTAPVATPVTASEAPTAPVPPAASVVLPADAAAAVSVAGADEYLGAAASGMWMTGGTNEPRPIASITKLITTLVILDAYPLASADDPGPTITFDKADHDLYDTYYLLGATIAAMPTGSSLSQRDALAMLLIPSASNYADAVSTWAFGSRSAFIGAAEDWLAAQGLTSTTIVEPSGIDPRNTSTPSDLIALGKIAAANPVVSQLAATRSLSLPGPGVIENTNDLLGTDGITGLKTGNLGPGSYNLLYTASLDVGAGVPLQVTGVVLGGASRPSVNQAVRATLESIRAGFHTVPVAQRGQQVGSYSTPWGSTATAVIAQDAAIFTWSDTPITAAMTLSTPTAYRSGEVVGSVTWTAGPHTVTAPVVIEGSITPPTEWWRLTHPSELGAPWDRSAPTTSQGD